MIRDRRRRRPGMFPQPRAPTEPQPTVVVHVDGGARGNPGPAGVGVVVTDERRATSSTARTTTSARRPTTTAEYRALLLGLERARAARRARGRGRERLPARRPPDHRRVPGQEGRPAPLHAQALAALRGFERWSVRSVPREQNELADELVNEAIDARRRRPPDVSGSRPPPRRLASDAVAGERAPRFDAWQGTIRLTPAACSSAAAPAPRRCATASGPSGRGRRAGALDAVLAGGDPGRRDAAVHDALGPAAGRLAVGRVAASTTRPTRSASAILVAFAGHARRRSSARSRSRCGSTARGRSCAAPAATSRRRACSSASS